MGLDMYLKAEKYLSTNSHFMKETNGQAAEVLKAAGLDQAPRDPGSGVTIQVTAAYWRKANAIHGWFVTHIQDGVDNCAPYYVDREKLIELRDLAAKILASVEWGETIQHEGSVWAPKGWTERTVKSINREDVNELQPKGGFFFGSTDLDENYVADLENTVNQIDMVLAAPEYVDCDFYYQSSW